MNQKDEYVIITKEIPFGQLLGFFRSSLGMAKQLKLTLKLPRPILERIIDTEGIFVIQCVVSDLIDIYLEADPAIVEMAEPLFLAQLANTQDLVTIHELCQQYLNKESA